MPIPFILAGVALATGAYGIKKGIDAKEDYQQADRNNKTAQQIVEDTEDSINGYRKDTSRSIERLGNRKIKIMADNMKIFVETYSQIKNIEFTDSTGIDELKNFKPGSPELKHLSDLSLKASDMLTAAGGSVAAGAALAAGTYGLVMSGGFAVASTGAGIAGLSGVAATNATLAWLGGGSLAAGGFGMAGGMAVLGGIVAGPALAIGGAFMASKAEKALHDSRSNKENAKKFAEEGKTINALLTAISKRAEQIEELLCDLDALFKRFNKDMVRTIKYSGVDYRNYDKAEKESIMHAALTAKTIKMVIDTSLLKEDGTIASDSEKTLINGRSMLAKLEE